jgi:hypothetical protein
VPAVPALPAVPDDVRTQLGDLLDKALTPQLLVALGAVAAWVLLLWFVVVHTRPAAMGRAAASQDLGGDESPALVSLFANRWRLTVDAVESTLLDLAARGHVELRQLGDDPRQTTIHVVDPQPDGREVPPDLARRKGPVQLTDYERQVNDRVRSLAKGGVLPITALTFRDEGEAKSWTQGFNRAVLHEARVKGLSRARLSPGLKRLLSLAALVPAGAAALWAGPFDDEDPAGAMISVGFVVWLALSLVVARFPGERDTEAGREAARRWAGLRRRLADDDAFGALPPSAVAVWDRYLPYGTALGVNHVCSAVLDLGMGDRKLVWSSFGGTWHRVRVRYPRFWGRYGRTALSLGFWGAVSAALGYALLRNVSDLAAAWRDAVTSTSIDPAAGEDAYGTARDVLLTIAVVLLVRGTYRLVRTLVDAVAPRHLTGEVLWCEVWKTKPGNGEDAPPVPVVHYVAVDDGSGDRTTAWALPTELLRTAVTGTTVRYTVRPWSRRVLAMARVSDTVADPISSSLPS